MIYFPHLEFVCAVKLANRATRRGDVKAAARWLRLAEHHIKLYRTYNAAEDEETERARARFEHLATLPVYRIKYRYFTDPSDVPPDAASKTRWTPGS